MRKALQIFSVTALMALGFAPTVHAHAGSNGAGTPAPAKCPAPNIAVWDGQKNMWVCQAPVGVPAPTTRGN
jgi:hypothetical protein